MAGVFALFINRPPLRGIGNMLAGKTDADRLKFGVMTRRDRRTPPATSFRTLRFQLFPSSCPRLIPLRYEIFAWGCWLFELRCLGADRLAMRQHSLAPDR